MKRIFAWLLLILIPLATSSAGQTLKLVDKSTGDQGDYFSDVVREFSKRPECKGVSLKAGGDADFTAEIHTTRNGFISITYVVSNRDGALLKSKTVSTFPATAKDICRAIHEH